MTPNGLQEIPYITGKGWAYYALPRVWCVNLALLRRFVVHAYHPGIFFQPPRSEKYHFGAVGGFRHWHLLVRGQDFTALVLCLQDDDQPCSLAGLWQLRGLQSRLSTNKMPASVLFLHETYRKPQALAILIDIDTHEWWLLATEDGHIFHQAYENAISSRTCLNSPSISVIKSRLDQWVYGLVAWREWGRARNPV